MMKAPKFRNALARWGMLVLVMLALLAAVPAFADEEIQLLELTLYQCGELAEDASSPELLAQTDFESYMIEKLKAQNASIDVRKYGMSPDGMRAAFNELLNSHPELFFVKGSWQGSVNSSNIVTTVQPDYKYTGEECQTRIRQFDAELSRIVSHASAASTPLGKVLLVNDYFCVNYQYDRTFRRHAADELFIDKTGVCQAYMLGFRAVMNALGISCIDATSTAMNHTWNMVRLDGSWYHIDVTWNDPSNDMPLRARHEYFLLSDAGIRAAEHYDWVSSASADNSQYDSFFWRELNTPLPVEGKAVYYVSAPSISSRIVRRWTADGGHEDVHPFQNGWSTVYGYYPLQLVDGRLCYATNNAVYLYDPDTDDATTLYSSSGYIMSAYYANGRLRVYIKDDSAAITISALPVTVTLDAREVQVERGANRTLAATVTNSENQTIVWSSKNPEIASVEGGRIVGLKPGLTEITAECEGAKASCKVLVYQITLLADGELAQGRTVFPKIEALPYSPDGEEPFDMGAMGWSVTSSAPEVVRANADGTITPLNGGSAVITVHPNLYPEIGAECAVTVAMLTQLTPPEALTAVEAQAFAGSGCQRVNLNGAVRSIGSRAFANCAALRLVCFGRNVTAIAPDAFDGCSELVFLCPADSAAARYAEEHGLEWSDSGE